VEEELEENEKEKCEKIEWKKKKKRKLRCGVMVVERLEVFITGRRVLA